MHDFEGWLRERLGRTVNKVMLLRNVGEFYEQKPVVQKEFHQDGTVTEKLVSEPRKIIKWRVVMQKYFGHWEKFWSLGKKGFAYELELANEAYGRGETHVQFIDYDTGDSLNFTGRVLARKDPTTLNEAIDVKVVKAFSDRLKGSGFMVVWFLVGFFIGGLLLFMIGQNWESIVSAIGQIGKSAPVPTNLNATFPPVYRVVPVP